MRYKKPINITVDPDTLEEVRKRLPQGKVRTLSGLIQKLLDDFLESELRK